MSFLQHERSVRGQSAKRLTRRLSSESVYLEIADLRASIALPKTKKLLPTNIAQNLSPPPLETLAQSADPARKSKKLLAPEKPRDAAKPMRSGRARLAYAPASSGGVARPALDNSTWRLGSSMLYVKAARSGVLLRSWVTRKAREPAMQLYEFDVATRHALAP